MNASKSPVAILLATGLMIPLMQRMFGRPLTEAETAIAMAAPATIAHWLETTPVLARARAWWSGKPTQALTPQQMAQIVPDVVKMTVPIVLNKLKRDDYAQ